MATQSRVRPNSSTPKRQTPESNRPHVHWESAATTYKPSVSIPVAQSDQVQQQQEGKQQRQRQQLLNRLRDGECQQEQQHGMGKPAAAVASDAGAPTEGKTGPAVNSRLPPTACDTSPGINYNTNQNKSNNEDATNSGFVLYSSTNPTQSLASGTSFNPGLFNHYNTTPAQVWPTLFGTASHGSSTSAPLFAPNLLCNPQSLHGNSNPTMDYQNAGPRPGGLHYQPPVPDTTFGPMEHRYYPRHDNGAFAMQGQVGAPPIQLVAFQPAPVQQPASNVTVIGQAPQSHNPPPVYIAHHQQQPGLIQSAPMAFQTPPVVMNANPIVQAPQPHMGMNLSAGTFVPGGIFAPHQQFPPDICGIGRTGGEMAMQNAQFAYENGLYTPQDFKPADDDPSRYYPVREVDGTWTQRNRFTIDNLGDCRWYVTDAGYFYAVRLPN